MESVHRQLGRYECGWSENCFQEVEFCSRIIGVGFEIFRMIDTASMECSSIFLGIEYCTVFKNPGRSSTTSWEYSFSRPSSLLLASSHFSLRWPPSSTLPKKLDYAFSSCKNVLTPSFYQTQLRSLSCLVNHIEPWSKCLNLLFAGYKLPRQGDGVSYFDAGDSHHLN